MQNEKVKTGEKPNVDRLSPVFKFLLFHFAF